MNNLLTMIQKCDWESNPETPFLIGKTPQNKQTPFVVLVYLTKSFIPTPLSSHPQLIMNLNTVIGY